MKKRISRIIGEVTQRWKNTILGNTPIDVAQARKIITAYDPTARIFEVETPKQFYIAQSVLRGRMGKEYAKEVCRDIGTDDSFLSDLRKIGGMREVLDGMSWFRHSPTNIVDSTLREYFLQEANAKTRSFLRWQNDGPVNQFLLCDLSRLYNVLIRPTWSMPKLEAAERAKIETLRNAIGWSGRKIERAMITRHDALSGYTRDILNDRYDPSAHWYDATQSEILARLINIKNPAVTMFHEIFHHVPAFMRFRKGFLLLTKLPEVHLNDEQLFHNETGPAVKWPDNTKFWFLDGHELTQFGEKIIMAPKTITIDEIAAINNEEERRIAIDRYGWGKYLHESGGQVLDYRENWVDNTVEVLIAPGDLESEEARAGGWGRRQQPLRMVLACRSTGRKYFIGVPNQAAALLGMPLDPLNRNPPPPDLPKPNCELAQKWLAQGATCEFLPYAKHELNIVGAS